MFDIKKLNKNIEEKIKNISSVQKHTLFGTLVRSVGLTIIAQGLSAPIGTLCYIINSKGDKIEAVVTGFNGEQLFLMPLRETHSLSAGNKIISSEKLININISENLLGRVIDGAADPLDGKEKLKNGQTYPLYSNSINPLDRKPINKPLDVGIKAINSLLTIGQGQRIGLFSGSGVGKSILLGMMSKFSNADVIVIGLIGERGREVKEFIDKNLGEEGLSRSVVIATPADYSPVLRLHGALMSLSIAEYFRDKGKNVLLLMDSLSRVAQAQREIALSMGEPPATKGYPPSVFSLLPQLVERAGNNANNAGSITGIFIVLAEGDDQNDPIVDCARSILDGHIVLNRKYAECGHYPAIDVCASVSRVMSNIVSEEHLEIALKFKKAFSLYQENEDLIKIGAYVNGKDPHLDYAIENISKLNTFLIQSVNEKCSFDLCLEEMKTLF